MQLYGEKPLASASDLVGFLECPHFTTLSLKNLVTKLEKAKDDDMARLIQEKGYGHEAAYMRRLENEGLRVKILPDEYKDPAQAAEATKIAMREGHDVIVQATFISKGLLGRADFLVRVDRPSDLGPYSYEVKDTKLARSAKAKFVVQLAFYSDLLQEVQGIEPQSMHVVLGSGDERSFRVANYGRYFRHVRGEFLRIVEANRTDTYPERCSYCPLCPWRNICDDQWRVDDHLNQVAGITKIQIQRLQASGTSTLAALAALPRGSRIGSMQDETVEKLRSQAALQFAYRNTHELTRELLALDPERRRGFFRMPQPNDGDVFFDMEGDPLDADGLEYLFGVRYTERGRVQFRAFWGHSKQTEVRAFQEFMDFITERRARYPGMHAYHYGAYEQSALKRLMSIHGTREAKVDDLLRERVLVDLLKVVREAMRTSTESYSLKDVERFYMVREGEIKNAAASIVHYERYRTTKDEAELARIQAYNEVDCESTQLLRNWLLSLRPSGLPWHVPEAPGPEAKESAPNNVKAIEETLANYRERLLGNLPADRTEWTTEHEVRDLTFQLLNFHRREQKPRWWAMFARQDMSEEELIDEIECIGGLQLLSDRPPIAVKKSLVYTFGYPEQETKLRVGSGCCRTDTTKYFGEITALDEVGHEVHIKVAPGREIPARFCVGPEGPININALRAAVWRFADDLLDGGSRFAAIGELLRKAPPRLKGRSGGSPIVTASGEDVLNEAFEAVMALDSSYLFVQGPPGAGKTTAGARLIVGLLGAGKRVGVTSNSHKVINNLLKEVETVADHRGVCFAGAKKSDKDNPDTHINGRQITDFFKNADVIDARYRLIAGTAWLCADADLQGALDYLFIDEAGQVSIAQLVAMGNCAHNIILLGDQMQLSQPIQGVHPGRSGESILEYLLDDQAAVAPDRGIFLGTTWRMHGDICRFISDAVYDSRLEPEKANSEQRLLLDGRTAHSALRATGIRFVPVVHEGCAQKSHEEAQVVREVLQNLLTQRVRDKRGDERPLTLDDVLVVAPYNAQVNHLKSVLPAGARVGTIDKFQGQQAEVVIVSLATSSGEYLPRNIEFLYSKNRLNVAVSRAKCLAILVASPALLSVRCNSVEQIELVNTVCWLQQYADAAGAN